MLLVQFTIDQTKDSRIIE